MLEHPKKASIIHTVEEKQYVDLFVINVKKNFLRDKGSIDPKRLSNHYHHVCPTCDPKRFAQKKGVEKRKKLDLPADGLVTIDKL